MTCPNENEEKIDENLRSKQISVSLLGIDEIEEMEILEDWKRNEEWEDYDKQGESIPTFRHRQSELFHMRFARTPKNPDEPLEIVDIQYEIDEAKDRLNREKHGVPLRLAASVLSDEDLLRRYDDAHSSAEDRWNILGRANTRQGRYLFVVYAQCLYVKEGLTYQIISARKALPEEVRLYDYCRYKRKKAQS